MSDQILSLVKVHGTGRIIRKDGTIEYFTLEGEVNGSNISDSDAERDCGRSRHGDRNDRND